MSSWLTTLQSQSESLLTQLDAVAADQLTPARRGESGATAISNTFLVGDGEGPGSDAALASGQQRLQASSAAPLRDIASKSRPKVGVIAKSTTSGTASSGKSAAQLASENKMLLSEVSALQTEVADFATRVRRAQDQLSDKTSRLALCERQLRDLQRAHEDELLSHQQTSNQLAQSTKELSDTKAKVATLEKSNKSLLSDQAAFNVTGSAALENAQSNLAGVKASLEAERDQLAAALADAQDKAATHRADIHEMAVQRDTLEAEAAESKAALADQIRRVQADQRSLAAVQRDFAEYKVRAARVLQTKEKLIAELRGRSGDEVGGDEGESSTSELLVRTRQENAVLESRLQEAKAELLTLGARLQDVEEQGQTDLEMVESQVQDLESALAAERERSAGKAEQLNLRLREAQLAKDEAVVLQRQLQAQCKAQAAEVLKLKAKLNQRRGAAQQTSGADEQRLRGLTENLLQKQAQIESLTARTSQLQLQLEAERQRARQGPGGEDSHAIRMPYADDGGGRMQPILPYYSRHVQTGFGKHVSTAANVLDTFSIRLGVFLRRNPIARIIVIAYMLLLHLWVMVVLLTYTPEVHGADHGGAHESFTFGGPDPHAENVARALGT